MIPPEINSERGGAMMMSSSASSSPEASSYPTGDLAVVTTTSTTTTKDSNSIQEDLVPTPIISNRFSTIPIMPVMELPPPCTQYSSDGNKEEYRPRSIRKNEKSLLRGVVDTTEAVTTTQVRFSSSSEPPIVMSPNAFLQSESQQQTKQQSQAQSQQTLIPISVPALELPTCSSNEVFVVDFLLRSAVQWMPVARNKLRHSILSRIKSTTTTDIGVDVPTRRRTIRSALSTTSPSAARRLVPYTCDGRTRRVRGIPNYGQTCFLNSVLQALASLEPVVVYLERVLEIHEEQKRFQTALDSVLCFEGINFDAHTAHDPSHLGHDLLHFLKSVNGFEEGTGGRLDPRPLLQMVGRKHGQFQARFGASFNAEQQDAQELLHAVLDMVVVESGLDTSNSAFPSTFVAKFSRPDGDDVISAMSGLLDKRQQLKRQTLPEKEAGLNNSELRIAPDSNGAREKGVFDASTSDGSSTDVASLSFMASQREEKKQDDFEEKGYRFEVKLPHVSSEEELFLGHRCPLGTVITPAAESPEESVDSCSLDDSLSDYHMTKAMEILLTTTSPLTPSPFCGWVGSALMCRTCRRVRPIQNSPFLNIPVVPTAVSQYLNRRPHPGDPPHKPGTREPPCRLQECLEEFTSIERVSDVECRYCTILAETNELEGEKELLEQTIRGLKSRRRASTASQDFKHLEVELNTISFKLDSLRKANPADDGPLVPCLDELEGEEPIEMRRSDAFKCLVLTRLPAVLSIHVQRRYYDRWTDRTTKTMQHVIFPEVLDVAPYCAYNGSFNPETPFAGTLNESLPASPQTPIHYRLVAVIEHQGGPFSGHYVCFRRDPCTVDGWLWISDDTVRECDWDTVRRSQAYMLFYEAM